VSDQRQDETTSGSQAAGRKTYALGYEVGFLQGQLEQGRWMVRMLLMQRFDILPFAVFQRIEACLDLERLIEAAVVAKLDLRSLDDFRL
jgi:hypothetical protein